MAVEWETVDKGSGYLIQRTKVPGGWLIESSVWDSDTEIGGCGVGICFYPDPEHKWAIASSAEKEES